MARKTYFKKYFTGRNVKFLQGGGNPEGNVPPVGLRVTLDDGTNFEPQSRQKSGWRPFQGTNVHDYGLTPEEIDWMTPDDLMDAYYRLNPEMEGYDPDMNTGKKYEAKYRKWKDEMSLLNRICKKINGGYGSNNIQVGNYYYSQNYPKTMSQAIFDVINDGSSWNNTNASKLIKTWVDEALKNMYNTGKK